MVDLLQHINELPIEFPYGSIEDPWASYAFAATQLRAILVTVNSRPKSTAHQIANDAYGAHKKVAWPHYQTVHATGYDAI